MSAFVLDLEQAPAVVRGVHVLRFPRYLVVGDVVSIVIETSILFADYVAVLVVLVEPVARAHEAVLVVLVVDIVELIVQVVADEFLRGDGFRGYFARHVAVTVGIELEGLAIVGNKFRHRRAVRVVYRRAAHLDELIQVVVAVALLGFIISARRVEAVVLVAEHVADGIELIRYILAALPPLVPRPYAVEPPAGGVVAVLRERAVAVVYARPLPVLVVEDVGHVVELVPPVRSRYGHDLSASVVAVCDLLAVGVDDVLHAPEVVRAVLRRRRLRRVQSVQVRVQCPCLFGDLAEPSVLVFQSSRSVVNPQDFPRRAARVARLSVCVERVLGVGVVDSHEAVQAVVFVENLLRPPAQDAARLAREVRALVVGELLPPSVRAFERGAPPEHVVFRRSFTSMEMSSGECSMVSMATA